MSDLYRRVGKVFGPAPISPQIAYKKYYGDEEWADYPSRAWEKVQDAEAGVVEMPSQVDRVEDAEQVDEHQAVNPLLVLSINDHSKRLIINALRSELEGRYRSFSDEDGFKFSVVWGLLDIEAVHHYAWNELHHRFDSKIEIVGVFDMDGGALPGWVDELKKYQ